MRLYVILLLFVATLMSSARAFAQKLIPPPALQESWSKPYEPFRIAGNLYYVGTYDLGCYLIATQRGHILINTGLAESVPMIQASMQKMGFLFSDIKILLTTQAHYDHVGGMAKIRKMTGATLMIQKGDSAVLADGGNSDYVFGGKGSTFVPVTAGRVLGEIDTIRLGGMEIMALHHPGHTKGSTSFLFDVKDENKTYRVLIANLPTILKDVRLSGMATYPHVGNDFATTLDAMGKIRFDIFLASHANQFMLHEKRKPGDPYNPVVFIDRKGYDDELNELRDAYLAKKKAER